MRAGSDHRLPHLRRRPTATLQVSPSNTSTTYVTGGWFAALAKKYPSAVKNASFGAENNQAIIEPERKYADAAGAMGWNVKQFQIVPLLVNDWTPYVQSVATGGYQAVWPSDSGNITPYFQAMTTTGYNPAFVLLGVQFYEKSTIEGMAGLKLPPVYVETAWWPLEMASQSPSTEQLLTIMHKYAKGDTVDFDDEEAAESWLLWAKEASACGASLTVTCVLGKAAGREELERRWHRGSGGPAGGVHGEPDPVAVLRPAAGQAQRLHLRQGVDHSRPSRSGTATRRTSTT